MKLTRSVLVIVFVGLSLAVSANGQADKNESCQIHLFVVGFNWDSPDQHTPNRLTVKQLKWWLDEGQKTFKRACLVETLGESDYVFMWSEKWTTQNSSISMPKVSTTQATGTVVTSSGGVGVINGTSSTTTYEQYPYEYPVQHDVGYLYKVIDADGKKRVNEIPIFVSSHKGYWSRSKPDKDVLVDALKHIEKQAK